MSQESRMNFEHLFKLLDEKRWDEFEASIKGEESGEFKCTECYNSHSLLHLVCHHQPPLFIVEDLVAKNPKSCLQTDCQGRLPLHVALINRASQRVVKFLLMKHKAAASKSTKEGKYPIHLLFENCNEGISSSKQKIIYTKQQIKDLDLIFRCICKVAPETLVIEDKEGINPIECAIEKEVDMSIIRRMGTIAQKVHKSRAA